MTRQLFLLTNPLHYLPTKVRGKYGDGAASHLKSHPFNGAGSCEFKMVYTRSRKKDAGGAPLPFRLSKCSVLEHSSSCTAIGKVKSRMLLESSGFRAAVVGSDGKLNFAGMTKSVLVEDIGNNVSRATM